MSKRLTGLNPLAYIGVEAITPPQMYLAKRAPTAGDSRNFNIGDLWTDEVNESLYVLVSLAAGEATWVTTFGGAATSFTTDSGVANESGGNINIVGDGVIIRTSGSGDSVSIGLSQATDGQLIIGNTGDKPTWANLSSGDNSVIVTNGPSSIGLTVNKSVVTGNGTNGQLLIGGGSAPAWASLTSDGSIIITPGVNTLEITAPNATGLTTVHSDSGTATQAAGAITIAGNTINTVTSATGSTVTVGVKNGSNGQLLIGGGSNATWANLTSTGATVTITNGANSINLETTGTGAGASQFNTNGSAATEALGVIQILGGSNITTSGSGNTVTVNVSGTTNHGVQVGNSGGSLTSVAVGSSGQVLIGSTGANPQFSTLTSTGGTVTFTPGPGTLNLESVGGGGGGSIITTTYNSPGSFTWTKNPLTRWVQAFGWTGGGGGGGGSRSASGAGGTGGGCGSFFRFSAPATWFAATETVVVGSGGIGGAGVSSTSAGNNGTDGGISSFAKVVAPVTVTSNNSGLIFTQGGEGGGQFRTGGSSGGAFLLDSFSLYPLYGSPNRNVVPAGLVAGVQTATVGGNGADQGGAGTPFYPFIFGIGTAGGAGGSIQATVPFSGGRGGTVSALDGSTLLAAGGTAGAPGIAGGDGVDFPSLWSGGTGIGGGIIYGGTGGGGGGAQNGGTPAGNGGNGGFPGGGGGAGGGCTSGTSGAGGNGASGLVVVMEWT